MEQFRIVKDGRWYKIEGEQKKKKLLKIRNGLFLAKFAPVENSLGYDVRIVEREDGHIKTSKVRVEEVQNVESLPVFKPLIRFEGGKAERRRKFESQFIGIL